MFVSAILNSDEIEKSIDTTVSKVRDEIQRVHKSSAVYSISDEPDIQAAERLRSHPLPHWVERMTVSYLNSHGGSAVRKRSWWELTWPDEKDRRKCVFSSREAAHLIDTTLLNLENNRVRGLALNLPQMVAGQPLPCISLNELPSTITGLWGLFEIRLQAGIHQKNQTLRIPMARRGYVSVFLSEEGKLFLPTARHIWDTIQTSEPHILDILSFDESAAAFILLQEASERAGQELFDALQQEHQASVAREEERGSVAFGARRKAIDRVGLAEVRQYRLDRCDVDETEWRNELKFARQITPEIRPLLLMRIISEVSQ